MPTTITLETLPAELLELVPEGQHGALVAWLDDDPAYLTAYADDPEDMAATFADAYMGEWFSLKDYAEDLAAELGYYAALEAAGASASYFDLEAFANDLKLGGDVWTAQAPGFKVYVFRNV